MMVEKYLTLLDSKIEAEKQRFVEELVDGRCIDFAVYRELSGVIRGLATAQAEVRDLLRIAKEADEN